MQQMRQHKFPFTLKVILAVIAVFAAVAVSISMGSSGIPFKDVLTCLFGDRSSLNQGTVTIITSIRIPRALTALLIGGILASVGSLMQGIFKNPMADPSVLGISSGAAAGAALAIVLGFTGSYIGAMIGAAVTWLCIFSIAQFSGSYDTSSTLLAGIAVSSIMSALITVLMTLHRENMERVYMWMLGSFSASTSSKTVILLIATLIFMPVLILIAPQIDILKLGDGAALTLGVKRKSVLSAVLCASSVLIAFTVANSGIIGFVGLIIPHVVSFFGVHKSRQRIIMSFLIGAAFTVICDTVAKTIAAPGEMPIGAITSIIGAPYFLWLVFKNRKAKIHES